MPLTAVAVESRAAPQGPSSRQVSPSGLQWLRAAAGPGNTQPGLCRRQRPSEALRLTAYEGAGDRAQALVRIPQGVPRGAVRRASAWRQRQAGLPKYP